MVNHKKKKMLNPDVQPPRYRPGSSSSGGKPSKRGRRTVLGGMVLPKVNRAKTAGSEDIEGYAKIAIEEYNKSKKKVGIKYVFKELLSAYTHAGAGFYYNMEFTGEKVILGEQGGVGVGGGVGPVMRKFSAIYNRVYGVVSFSKVYGGYKPEKEIFDKHFVKKQPNWEKLQREAAEKLPW